MVCYLPQNHRHTTPATPAFNDATLLNHTFFTLIKNSLYFDEGRYALAFVVIGYLFIYDAHSLSRSLRNNSGRHAV